MALRIRIAGSRSDSAAGVYVVIAFIGIVTFILVAVCLFFIGMGTVQAVRQERLLGRAVEVPGAITASRVQTSSFRSGSGRASGGSRATTHRPIVEFTYLFDGREFTGDRVFPLPQSGGAEWAERVAAGYSPGQSVTALVDPADPATAFLRRERVFGPYYGIAAGVVSLLVLGGIGGFVGLRLRRHLQAQRLETERPQPAAG